MGCPAPDVHNVDRLVWEACNANDHSLLRRLLAIGGQPNWCPEHDQSAMSCLCIAATKGDSAMIEDLVKHGADVNKADAHFGIAPLHIAATAGNLKLVVQLIKSGADVNKVDCRGHPALLMATCRHHVHIVRQLITSGADIDMPNKDGWTPLHIAITLNSVEMTRLLIKSGAKMDMSRNTLGWTALHVAVHHGRIDIAKELLEAGADRTTRDFLGLSPLGIAVKLGRSKIALLLTSGGDAVCWNNVGAEDFRKVLDIRAGETAEMSRAARQGLLLVLLATCTIVFGRGQIKRIAQIRRFMQSFHK